MQYVWRVRARDQSNRDLFKNQGYSQLCNFTYGSVLSQIDTNSIKLTLQGTALTYRLAKYTWDSLSIFLSYKLEYRKQGSPNWFPINTTTCKSIVNNLEPETTYEARAKGLFSEGDGPWSNVVTITTPAKPIIVCGQGGIPPLASNFIPLKTGNIAQVWNMGQFELLVTQLDNPNSPNGKYSGYGVIGIPFLMNMPLIGKFSNITVNEAMEVVEGKVEITTTGIDAWLQQWQPPPGWNETDNLHYNGSISNVTSDTGTIFINGQAFGNTGGNTLITDDNGNTYYVSADGSISTPEGPLETPVSDTITSIPDSLQNIVFTDGSNAQFAYDSKEISNQTAGKNYDMLQKGLETYPVACKLLQTGAQDNLTATLSTAAQEINSNSLVFKRSDGTIVPSIHTGNTYQLIVKGKLNLFADALWAFAKKKNSSDTTMYALGKINLISVDKKKKKIVIIPVNSIGINTDAASLQAQINAIYEKVAVEWEVTKAADLQVPGYTSDSLLNVTRSALNITYGADLRKIINAYKAVELSIDENTAYLFLVNKASNNDLGYMALNKKFGFIFLNNNSSIASTIAHEIGHGKLVLKHTFAGETSGSTQNIMDYNNGELFNQQQFRIIHDPNIQQNFLNTLVQDEDAGALVDQTPVVKNTVVFSTLYQIKQCVNEDKTMSVTHLPSSFYQMYHIKNVFLAGIQYDYIKIYRDKDLVTAPTGSNNKTTIRPKGKIVDYEKHAYHAGTDTNVPYGVIEVDGTVLIEVPYNRRVNMKLFLESPPGKNILLFVNGYRSNAPSFNQYPNTSNNVYQADVYNYWEGLDADFINRIGTKNAVYCDGHHEVYSSNHLTQSNFLYSLASSTNEGLALIHDETRVILNKIPNPIGFALRKTNGSIAGNKMYIMMLNNKIPCAKDETGKITDTVDVVAHSMGFAYAQGMIEALRSHNVNIKRYYIIAPENACSGSATLTDYEEIWQYGSNEKPVSDGGDPVWLQDGVAPQCAVGNLDNNRVYIPNSAPKGFTESHSIKNYGWIFNTILNGQNGYVKKRN